MFTPKSEQTEWEDVKAIEQDDIENIVVIQYSEEYKEVFGYFRAIVASGEKSKRAFNLTTECLKLNPFNPEIWVYRQQIIKKIKYTLKKELFYVDFLIREHPKNFLGWNHRRIIANMNLSMVDVYNELELTESILLKDPKNYYCWQHRQWLIRAFKFRHFGLPREELEFTNRLILEDVRNNSAWNQRFFIYKLPGYADMSSVKREFEYALTKIKMALENESSWNYLKGLLLAFGTKTLNQFEEASKFVNNLFYEEEDRSRFVVAYLIDLTIETTLESYSSHDILNSQKIKSLCQEMEEIDGTRRKYWAFVYKKFQFDKRKSQVVGRAAVDDSWKKKNGKVASDFDIYLNYVPVPAKKKVIFEKLKKYKKTQDKIVTKIGQDLLINLMNKYEHK